ncbi:P1 family peptidase [Nocardia sp. NPDC051030]|uniref:DmpA family aminopeptidase n=1 Tax=Nocardia sp. NPDC051030 TaxID=3155162 RepID=UPI0034472071
MTIEQNRRARDIGLELPGTPGPFNAITDVPGVEVGYRTLIEGQGELVVGQGPVRTGVTAILPRGRAGVGRPCTASWYSLNGNGEMTGTTWIDEVGELSSPITISNTHAVGACHAGVIEWINQEHPKMAKQWILPVCAETWDGYLNDINGGHVTPAVARAALDDARTGPVAEGSIGGGTGMNCYGFKGGNGTSSRRIAFGAKTFTVGVFVQANFGARSELTVLGRPVGRELEVPDPLNSNWIERDRIAPGGAGSVIVIVATDAPLDAKQCQALTRRVPMGLARTGTTGSFFSGDIFLAFSAADDRESSTAFPAQGISESEIQTRGVMPWNRMNLFYEAVAHGVEEAVLNALLVNQDMVGRDDHWSPALPHEPLLKLLGR